MELFFDYFSMDSLFYLAFFLILHSNNSARLMKPDTDSYPARRKASFSIILNNKLLKIAKAVIPSDFFSLCMLLR